MARAVSFSEKVETHYIGRIDAEDVPNLFYSKLDFRRFKEDRGVEQNKELSAYITRFINDTETDMDHRMAHANKIQEVEQILTNHPKIKDRDIQIEEFRFDDSCSDAAYDELLRLESERLDREAQKRFSRHKEAPQPSSYTDTRQFQELSSMLEDSCSSLLDFEPLDFEPVFPPIGV